ncbi:MAG: S1 RNA-binding domain-containing protein [Flavonifractor plautii]
MVTEENKGGVVVSIKGVRVFVPASQTGLPRETPMSQLLKQHVRLRITEVNRARRRVVGSIRDREAEERAAKAAQVWANIEENKRYTGTVKSLTSYSAFVDIGGVDGMVHISELSWSASKHPPRSSPWVTPSGGLSHLLRQGEEEDLPGDEGRSQNPWEGVHRQVSARRRGQCPLVS